MRNSVVCLLLCTFSSQLLGFRIASSLCSRYIFKKSLLCNALTEDEGLSRDPTLDSGANSSPSLRYQNTAKDLNEQLNLRQYELEIDTYKEESKVYLDDKSSKESILCSWNNINTEKPLIVSHIQGESSWQLLIWRHFENCIK